MPYPILPKECFPNPSLCRRLFRWLYTVCAVSRILEYNLAIDVWKYGVERKPYADRIYV